MIRRRRGREFCGLIVCVCSTHEYRVHWIGKPLCARADRVSIFVAGAKTTKNSLTDERRGSYAGSQRRRSFMTLRVFTVPRLRRKFSGQMVRACFYIGGKCLGELYYCRRDYNAFSQHDGICRGYPVVLIRRRPRPITPRAFFCPPRFFRKCSGTRRFVILMLGSFVLCQKVKLLIKRDDRV